MNQIIQPTYKIIKILMPYHLSSTKIHIFQWNQSHIQQTTT